MALDRDISMTAGSDASGELQVLATPPYRGRPCNLEEVCQLQQGEGPDQ